MNIMDIVKTTYAFDTNQLPKDVLSFTDEKFYGFVKEILGKTAADLLQIQAINNVPSFLLKENGKIKPRQKQTTTKIYSTPSVLTKENHVEFIHTSIKKWVEDTKENVNLDNLELKPGADYTLTITDNDNDLEGSIRSTPQQSLSQTFLNLPTSSSYRANVSSSSMTKGTKRISSNLTSTYSQQLSSAAKRHKK
ncbi:unnamed protein product [Rotaria sp. Silwood1]|nr:unnamed protein product [Rotaria sp. Silwood1]CAF5063083.1 unnamed protein product [Rotaria sp. Silwood1]